MRSFNEGSLDTRTWQRSLSHQLFELFEEIVFQDLFKPSVTSIGEKLVAKREFNNTMGKHAVKVVNGDETVGHFPRKFSRIVWYFLARSGEISVEVIGCRRCGRIEVPWQLEINFSKQSTNETLERTTGEQAPGLEPS